MRFRAKCDSPSLPVTSALTPARLIKRDQFSEHTRSLTGNDLIESAAAAQAVLDVVEPVALYEA